jgi:hypothetical protein
MKQRMITLRTMGGLTLKNRTRVDRESLELLADERQRKVS